MPTAPTIKGFIRDLDIDGEGGDNRLEFQWNPITLKKTNGSGWTELVIPGLSHPIQQFGGGGNKIWDFKLDFYGDDPSDSWVKQQVAWLESLTYPEYDDSGFLAKAPHSVLFVLGQFVTKRCRVKKCDPTFGDVWTPDTWLPRKASVEMQLVEDARQAVDFRIVRLGL